MHRDLRAAREEAQAQEQNFQRELGSAQKLADMYKEMANARIQKCESLEGVLRELKVHLEVLSRPCACSQVAAVQLVLQHAAAIYMLQAAWMQEQLCQCTSVRQQTCWHTRWQEFLTLCLSYAPSPCSTCPCPACTSYTHTKAASRSPMRPQCT